jgi:nicotinamide riboside kinase
MIVINYFGGPGSGKSTQAAGLFYLMKKAKYNVELVTEFAKDLVYEKNLKALSEQNYIFANQEYRLSRLKDSVDYVITDSPIILSNIYAKDYPHSFHIFCEEMFSRYNNVNIFINRNHEYSTDGRTQTENEAQEISLRIKNYLREFKIPFKNFTAGDDTPEEIYKQLLNKKII